MTSLRHKKTRDTAIFVIKDQSENNEENDNDGNYKEPENLKSNYKTATTYLEEIKKIFLTISNN